MREMIEIDHFVPDSPGAGPRCQDWVALAFQFVAARADIAVRSSVFSCNLIA